MRTLSMLITLAVAVTTLTSCANLRDLKEAVEFSPMEPLPHQQFVNQQVDDAIAAKYAIYAMMSSNSYHDGSREYFDLRELGWEMIDMKGNIIDKSIPAYDDKWFGLQFDIYKHFKTGRTVFAYRGTEGTDDPADWFAANLAIIYSPQYSNAKKMFNAYLQSLNETEQKNLAVTGHSLGGGLALSVSLRNGIYAVVFDSSPRIFDGLGDCHMSATRISIHEDDELLERPRKLWGKFEQIIPKENRYESNYNFGKNLFNKHNMDKLAKSLLVSGSRVDPDLKRLCDKSPKGCVFP